MKGGRLRLRESLKALPRETDINMEQPGVTNHVRALKKQRLIFFEFQRPTMGHDRDSPGTGATMQSAEPHDQAMPPHKPPESISPALTGSASKLERATA